MADIYCSRENAMHKIRFGAIAAAIALVISQIAMADSGGSPTVPLPTLTAEWWQWTASIPDVPSAPNPTSDTTGASCMVGQRGAIWFLVGAGAAGGGGTAIRTCSVPEGTMLFFPVINSVYFNTPDCGQSGQSFTVKQLRKMVKPLIDNVRNLSVEVVKADGTNIKNYLLKRVQSEPFAAAFPDENFFGPDACAAGQALPAGIYSPSVDDGYYVLIPPLKSGLYDLHFHAESGALMQDVTYHLTVVVVSLK
jgi:hypothetical protein